MRFARDEGYTAPTRYNWIDKGRPVKQRFTARVWREDGWHIAQCGEVDVASHGATEEEALTKLQEALELYFEPPTAKNIPKLANIEVEVGASQLSFSFNPFNISTACSGVRPATSVAARAWAISARGSLNSCS
jgi:predicted RNase H-like HicB family nuclease